MTHIEAHFEKHTNGTSVTTANSDDFGDDPFNAFFLNGMTVVYDTTIAAHGTGSIKYSGGSTSGDYAGWYFGALAATQAVCRFYIRLTGLPNSVMSVFEWRGQDDSILAQLNLNSNGTLLMKNATTTSLYTSTVALNANQWYRIETGLKVATSGGQIKFAAYTGDTTSAALISYDSGTTLNTGSTNIYTSVVGKLGTAATIADFNVDDWGVQDGTLTYLSAYTPGPVLIAKPNQGVAVIDCSQTYVGVNGDTLSYTISPNTNVTQPVPGIFLIPEQPDPATYTITATESNGKTDVQTVTVPGQLPGGLGFRTKRYSGGAWI